jgi:hypothetical protein
VDGVTISFFELLIVQLPSITNPFLRLFLFALTNSLALCVYALGLLAPLTPSEGLPSVPVLLLFVGLPVALLGACIRVAGAKWWAGFFGLQILAILAFTTYLLLLQSGVFAG